MSLLLLYSALEAAAEWSFARSSGPGGQNVNKVNSKAILAVPLEALTLLSEHQRSVVATKLSSRIFDGSLTIQVQDSRSQWENREVALHRLEALIRDALVPRKARRATKPTRGSQERRMAAKKATARNKQGRSRSFED